MPLHLDSIIKSNTTEIFSWILQHELNQCEDAYVMIAAINAQSTFV